MLRLASSRNVQWSAKGAGNCAYPRFQNLVNLSLVSDQENFDESTEKKDEKNFEKNENCNFSRKT